MSLIDLDGGQPLGVSGIHAPAGSVSDTVLASTLAGYKRGLASRYTSLREDELEKWLGNGPFLVSRKIDGELWFLVVDGQQSFLASPNGRVIAGELPLLAEAVAVAERAHGRTVIAGELYAHHVGEGRVRVGDLAEAMGGGAAASVDRLRFAAFDLLAGGTAEAPSPALAYADRHAVLVSLLSGGDRLAPVPTESVEDVAAVHQRFRSWVIHEGAEGIVVRGPEGRIYKVKPCVDIDAAIVAYSVRSEDPDQVRSLLLALMRPDGRFQLFGSCGNIPIEHRRGLLPRLKSLHCDSDYRRASSDGALYLFVDPEIVVQVRLTDIQGELATGRPVRRMVLERDGGWKRLREMPGASPIHPVFERVREDKAANETDIRIAQVLDRCPIAQVEGEVASAELPESEILRREVYTKTIKGSTGVRKLLVWRTNKSELDPRFPPFVLHFTDYSPGRRDPIKHDVEIAPTEEAILAAADQVIEKNIKRGWDLVK